MRSAKKLSLAKEALTPLTTDELDGVVGGEDTTSVLSRLVDPCVIYLTQQGSACTLVSRIIDPCLP